MQKSNLNQRVTRLKTRRILIPSLVSCSLLILTYLSGRNGWAGSISAVHGQGIANELSSHRVNAPYASATEENVPVAERAIFWFGEVGFSENFTDVRIIYNDDKLSVTFHIYDRLLWYKQNPLPTELTAWDAATLYLQVNPQPQNGELSTIFKFIGQLSMMSQPRDAYQSAYRLDGATWTPLPGGVFETKVGTQSGGFNDIQDDRGWNVTFYIPFSTVGLDDPPAEGTTWHMGLVTHDRDGIAPTLPDRYAWPEAMDAEDASTWGELAFGLPEYHAPPAIRDGATIIRNGVGGNTVVDSHAGGGMVCGSDIEVGGSSWPIWGNHNRGGTTGANVQNQWNLGDWPCFSKYYVTFPLDDIPPAQLIISATLTLSQFGNSGQDESLPDQPEPSLIQVLTVNEDWSEQTLTWNNAPLVVENISRAWVDPIPPIDDRPYEHIARHWDVSYAVAEAYAAGQPLRLAVYSADSAKNSGKYFRTSEFHDVTARPTLNIVWGHPMIDPNFIHLPLLVEN